MLAQYLLHNNETLSYIEHVLYRLDKIKITFENYCPINVKLFRSTFNYLKFYTITYFLQYIWDYSSTINYHKANSKAMQKDLLKAFYKRTNKKNMSCKF